MEWTLTDYAALAAFALAVGVAIGSTGIGGVVLVPYLVSVAGMPVLGAIASTIAGFIFVGIAGSVYYGRRGAIDWRMAAWLAAGAAPGTWLGSVLVTGLDASWVAMGIALLMMLSGADSLLRTAVRPQPRMTGGVWYLVIGLVVGLVSGLTGTGGPVTLIPFLIWLGQAPIAIVAMSQIIQIPISGSAIIVHLLEQRIDWTITLILASSMMLGVRLGAGYASGRNPAVLRRILAVSLLLVGFILLLRHLPG